MKKTLFFFLTFFLSAAVAFGEARTDVNARSGKQNGVLRLVFESGEEFIKKANVSAVGTKINIEFPSLFNLQSQKGFDLETSVKDRVLTITPMEPFEVKVMKLSSPPRLVIDIFAVKQAEAPIQQQEVGMPHKVFVIDPGHGGYDFGITGNDMKEKDITLFVAKDMEGLLSRKDKKVFLTRRSDQFISLKDRAMLSEQKFPDAFISIHVAASENFVVYVPEIREGGQEESAFDTYGVGSKQKKYIQKSRALAEAVGKALKEEFNLNVVQREMFLPVINYAAAPAVMIEIPSFKIMNYDQKTRARLAEAVIKGMAYYGQ